MTAEPNAGALAPAINVNLKPCTCGCPVFPLTHVKDCPGRLVLVPCQIPRSITLTMNSSTRCNCGGYDSSHDRSCPRYGADIPIRVVADIGGATWEESHLTAWETEDGIGLNTTMEAKLASARWETVKAVLLNTSHAGAAGPTLLTQRDKFFAALALKAEAEERDVAAYRGVVASLPAGMRKAVLPEAPWYNTGMFYYPRPSEALLARYVEHLVEQVGSLT